MVQFKKGKSSPSSNPLAPPRLVHPMLSLICRSFHSFKVRFHDRCEKMCVTVNRIISFFLPRITVVKKGLAEASTESMETAGNVM